MTDIDREFNEMCDRQRPKTHGEIRDEMIRANFESAAGESVVRLADDFAAWFAKVTELIEEMAKAAREHRLTPDPDPLQDPQR